MANRVIHFEISADDPARAKKFYENVFGWEIKKWQGNEDMDYWLITTGPDSEPGIDGGLMKRTVAADPDAGNNAFACTIGVDSLTETRQKIEENGGKVFSGAMEIPDMGAFQSFIDPEGNYFAIMQGMNKM